MLQEAEAGVFDRERVEGLSPERLRRHFLDGSGAFASKVKIKDKFKQSITFRMLNLMQPVWDIERSGEGQFDAIFCRNVMIYFDKDTQYQILKRFVPLLKKPHGLLFAGHSEAFFNAKDIFTPMGATTYKVADHAA